MGKEQGTRRAASPVRVSRSPLHWLFGFRRRRGGFRDGHAAARTAGLRDKARPGVADHSLGGELLDGQKRILRRKLMVRDRPFEADVLHLSEEFLFAADLVTPRRP